MKQYFYIVDLIRNIYCSSCSNEDSDNIDCSVLVENILYNNQDVFICINQDTFICINDNVETPICFSPQIYRSECLTGGSCRTLLDIIGFYDHVYTNLIRSPYCDNAINGVKDLLVGIAILPETIQPTITRDQYLQSLEALLTNTPSGITITFGNVSNQLIEFLATLFATNPRAYIYYTTSFDIEDNRLTTFANELSNNLSTYLDESHPLYRDLLVVLLSTNLA